MSRSIVKLALWVGLAGAIPVVRAGTCYSYYGGYYDCSGLSNAARVGIAIAIAVAVLLLLGGLMYWRRRKLRAQWSKFRPPAVSTAQNEYASNPPPPTGSYGQGQSYQGQGQGGYGYNYGQNNTQNYGQNSYQGGQNASNWNSNPYGYQPSAPANTYQPSMAGQYGGYKRDLSENGGPQMESGTNGMDGNAEGEWAQARQQQGMNGGETKAEAPPGYDVTSNPTGTSNSYEPPPGPPPPIIRDA